MISELLAGAALLPRGFGLVINRRRLFLLGGLPPLFTSIVFLTVLIVLISNIGRLTSGVSGLFADSWADWLRIGLEVAAGVVMVGGSALVMVLVFSSVTLLIGSPIYDKIAEMTEASLGDAPEPHDEGPLVSTGGRAIGQSLLLVLISLVGSLTFALLGLVPVLGQVAAPVLSACFGGWLLGIELLGTPFGRRGLTRIGDRRAAMARRRARTLGFAVPCFLLLAIPFISVLIFPAAVAGAVLLARDLVPKESAAG
jgi:CysZ protein